MKTLKQIATELVGEAKAEKYLKRELPYHDPSCQFQAVFADAQIQIWRAEDIYLLHSATGLEVGMWNSLLGRHPQFEDIPGLTRSSDY